MTWAPEGFFVRGALQPPPPPEPARDGESSSDDDWRVVATSAARSLAIRYSILLPKVKAANFFQPEDHVSAKHIDGTLKTRMGGKLVGASHMASIFASGTVLFMAQEWALRRLEPESKGDFGKATPASSALAGAYGGAWYAVWATVTAAWLHTGGFFFLGHASAKLAFLRTALPYTLCRDAGGFGLYFGAYSFAHRALTAPAAEASAPPAAAAPGGDAAVTAAGARSTTPTAPAAPPAPSFLDAIWPGATPSELLKQAGATAVSGGLSGLCTYLWRSPWDTLYKRAVGWRAVDEAPLWSWQRFLKSPRGLKAIGIGAATWSAYELADAGLRSIARADDDTT